MTIVGTAGRPVIGIGAHTGQVNLGGADRKVTFVPQVFISRLIAAGCTPVMVPPFPGCGSAVATLDGLLLLAGPDLDPATYSARPHQKTGRVDPGRDTAELELVDAALGAGVPILGICRGMQVLNILRQGTLHQHLPDIVGHDNHLPGQARYGAQPLRLRPDSWVADIFDGKTAVVPCHHHQAVDQLGADLVATAWSEDGTVEAIEATDHPFAVGVQWHAEESEDDGPFLALAEAAATLSPRLQRK
jgi:putative glutamine amidotransferase